MGGIVLVHGAWHGAWCWDGVVDAVRQRGAAAVAVQLPLTGYRADVATAREAIEAAGPGAVVCGHSYGGLVITEAAAGLPGVGRLVYLSSFQTEPGEDPLTLLASEPSTLLEALAVDGDALTVAPAVARDVFYHQADSAVAAAAIARLRPMPATDVPAVSGEPAWKAVPSTYIVCTEDRAIAPALQRRMAARADEVVEWPTDHSPFLTRPDDIASILVRYAEAP